MPPSTARLSHLFATCRRIKDSRALRGYNDNHRRPGAGSGRISGTVGKKVGLVDALRTQARQPNARRSTNVGSYGPYTTQPIAYVRVVENMATAPWPPTTQDTIGFTLPIPTHKTTRRRCRHRLVASSTMATRGPWTKDRFPWTTLHETTRHLRVWRVCTHFSAAVRTHLPLAWAWAWATCRAIHHLYLNSQQVCLLTVTSIRARLSSLAPATHTTTRPIIKPLLAR